MKDIAKVSIIFRSCCILQFNREERNDLLNRLKCDPTLLTEPHVTFRTDLFTSSNADNIDAMIRL